jgi:hypothetical protein
MSAESLYNALHDTIKDQLDLDDPISPYELIGVIEMMKADVLASMMDGEPEDPEPMFEIEPDAIEPGGACCMAA